MSDIIGYPDSGLDLSEGFKPHNSHWGVFSARLGEAGLEVRPYAGDFDPNGIIGNFPAALRPTRSKLLRERASDSLQAVTA
jgi:biotin/methionine sulfoxide reductase